MLCACSVCTASHAGNPYFLLTHVIILVGMKCGSFMQESAILTLCVIVCNNCRCCA